MQIYVNDFNRPDGTQVGICKSIGDPHVTTFDGVKYTVSYTGDFILYRNTDYNNNFPFMVQGRFKRCNSQGCNCGVAVQVGWEVWWLDRCKHGMSPRYYDNTPPGVRQARASKAQTKSELEGNNLKWKKMDNNGNRYHIYLPNGAMIETYTQWDYIQILFYASTEDFRRTEGLCGSFDNNPSNDFIPRNRQTSNEFRSSPEFYESWLVDKDDPENLFDNNFHWDGQEYLESKMYCVCNELEGVSECRYFGYNQIEACNPPNSRSGGKGVDMTPFYVQRAAVMASTNYHDYVMAQDIDNLPFAQEHISHSENYRRHKRSISKWTEEQAEQYCRQIIDGSGAAQSCRALPALDFEQPIENCIFDIMATGDTAWAESALEDIKSCCAKEIQQNISTWEVNESETGEIVYVVPPEIEESLCINDCSGNGECVEGECVCDEGFISTDCSVDGTAPPDVYLIPHSGLCDVRSRPCEVTSVIGDRFVGTPELSCHIRTGEVSTDGFEPTDEVRITAAFHIFSGEVRCSLELTNLRSTVLADKPAAAFYISVSNDGVTPNENTQLFVVYDSVCQSCDNSTGCTFKNDSCLIAGKCYSDGEEKEDQTCLICNPRISDSSWTQKEDSCLISNQCFSDREINPNDVCEMCNVSYSRSEWSVNPSSCEINGECFGPQAPQPEQECLICDPTSSTTSWTRKPNTCLIEEQCFDNLELNPDDDCQFCNAIENPNHWTYNVTHCIVTTSSTTGAATTPGDINDWCKEKPDGNHAHPTDCTKFIKCSHGHTSIFDCPPGLHYNEELQQCDWPESANCHK